MNYERAADCAAPTGQFDLALNNVRARIYNGGDMWWDLQNTPKYEIPINSGKNSLFASSLWIGGVDAGGNLKVAAQTYRQSGVDFFAGPLDNNASKFGGMHFIYVLSSEYNATINGGFTNQGLSSLGNILRDPSDAQKRNIYKYVSWAGCPMANDNQDWLSTKATVQIRVNRPYESGLNSYQDVSSPENNNYPLYSFSTEGIYNDQQGGKRLYLDTASLFFHILDDYFFSLYIILH